MGPQPDRSRTLTTGVPQVGTRHVLLRRGSCVRDLRRKVREPGLDTAAQVTHARNDGRDDDAGQDRVLESGDAALITNKELYEPIHFFLANKRNKGLKTQARPT